MRFVSRLILLTLLVGVALCSNFTEAGTGTRADIKEKKNQGDPAYDAPWGKGRGFKVGQTLPDIPLYDMKGKEVRFSKYLGKQYILYCWASW